MQEDQTAGKLSTGSEILPILKTKLFTPPLRTNVIARPNLIQRLEEGFRAGYRLTLVSAPAGFGKTTLLSEWVHHMRSPSTWLSLDEGENDFTRFLTYVIASLRTIESEIGESARDLQSSPQPPHYEVVLTSLINNLAEIENRFIFVLDDYHVIESESIHQAVGFIMDHLPPQVHLVIATREDPPLPIARLRSRRQLTEISERDLQFSPADTVAYLNKVMQLNLTSEDAAALQERTEGWIAGIQMAAHSMQGRSDKTNFISTLSGTHRHILDFLVQEVLHRQPAHIQDFLLKTSILHHLSSPLCDALISSTLEVGRYVMVNQTSQEILEELDRTNLFILPLDDDRRWYRYHRLFAELLYDRLEHEKSDLIPELHKRASDWYEENGLIAETVKHMIAARDFISAARLIAENATAMVYQGKLTTLVHWMEALPEGVKRAHPWLSLAHAWALTFSGKLDMVADLLREAETGVETQTDLMESQRIYGFIDALRAYLIAWRGDMSHAIEFAREAMRYLPDEDQILRGFTATLLASVLRWKGDLKAAREAYEDAIAINRETGEKHVLVESLCDLAALQALEGHLGLSELTCREALAVAEQYLEIAGQRLPAHGYAYSHLSAVLRERNDLEGAKNYGLQGLELCERWGHAEFLVRVYLELARVYQAEGDLDSALENINEAVIIARDISDWYVSRANAWRARIQIAKGDLPQALQWLTDNQDLLSREIEYQNLDTHLTSTRIRIAQGRDILDEPSSKVAFEEALSQLDQIFQVSERSGSMVHSIEALILRAFAWEALNVDDEAMDCIKRALLLAEKSGFIRIFVDEGEMVGALLRKAATQGIAVEYAGKLLAIMEQEVGEMVPHLGKITASLVEPLSNREMEVLRLLSTHLTSTEIAAELGIAVSTVRSHTKNIYGKFDAHRRSDAVQKGKEYGYL
jgi:LuxR family maltose regulon positive regulatory protein